MRPGVGTGDFCTNHETVTKRKGPGSGWVRVTCTNHDTVNVGDPAREGMGDFCTKVDTVNVEDPARGGYG